MADITSDYELMLKVMLAGDPELSDFLQARPHGEELGESLDVFRKQLEQEGQLTEKRKKQIESCHIYYRSNLLDSDLPIKSVSEINISEDCKIKEFCEDQVFLYNANLSEEHLRGFADAYKSVSSLYVIYNMAKIMLRYHIMDKAIEYYNKALELALFSTDSFWNNNESLFACSELLYDIVSSEQFNNSKCEEDLLRKVLEYTYMLLSRVILWPDNIVDRFEEFDVPITYRHKISSLNKRAEILLKHKDLFRNHTPSFSTPETLAISDYSSAHDLSFCGKQTGLQSLFKLDANRLYDVILRQDIRPFSTAILDGKKDSVELAHRYYLKFEKNKYRLSDKDSTVLSQLLQGVVKEKNVPISKPDEEQIRRYLSDNGIKYFYHFTERENIQNIKKNGGICSLKYCLIHAIEVKTKGDMTILRDTDAGYLLEDYARLSFCERHPLIKKRQESGADIVVLKIKADIACRYDTLFADRDAAQPHHQGNAIEDLLRVRMDAVRKSDLKEWDPDYYFNQAEVMVKSMIPLEYIVNIDNPIEISTIKPSSDKDTEVTESKLIKAIHTIVFLSQLFKNASFLMAGDGRNEKKRLTMYSFAGILGYLFEEEYHFGNYSSLVDKTMLQYYAFVKSTMNILENRVKVISDLANNWSSILQTILEIQNSRTEDSKTFIELQQEIDQVTDLIELISGAKCRKPIIGYAKVPESKRSQFYQDAFTLMISEAEFNPFKITIDPSLQNFPPLPVGLHGVFRAELLRLYHESGTQRNNETQIFISYVISLVISYYKNAGYVPKNTVDAIIEQCDQSIKDTLFGWHLPSLDEIKFRVYKTLLTR